MDVPHQIFHRHTERWSWNKPWKPLVHPVSYQRESARLPAPAHSPLRRASRASRHHQVPPPRRRLLSPACGPVVSASPLVCPAVIAVVQVEIRSVTARRHVDAGWACRCWARVLIGPEGEEFQVTRWPAALSGPEGRGPASWPALNLPGCRGDFPLSYRRS